MRKQGTEGEQKTQERERRTLMGTEMAVESTKKRETIRKKTI